MISALLMAELRAEAESVGLVCCGERRFCLSWI